MYFFLHGSVGKSSHVYFFLHLLVGKSNMNPAINQSINQHFIDITLRIRYSHLQLKTKLQTNNRVINALHGGNPI